MKGIPGTITAEGKYVEQQVIPCYMTDGGKQLKPASFMDIAQEMGFRAATAMHFGYDELMAEFGLNPGEYAEYQKYRFDLRNKLQ